MEIHDKVWGSEHWIVNNELYCGKKLILKKGYRCSYHYHLLKTETFYVQSGLVRMRFEGEEFVLKPGQRMHIQPGHRHSFEGLEDSEIFEFSTQHFEDDSYREDRSCKVAAAS